MSNSVISECWKRRLHRSSEDRRNPSRAGHIWQLRNEKIGNAADGSIYGVSNFRVFKVAHRCIFSQGFLIIWYWTCCRSLLVKLVYCGSCVSISLSGHFNLRHPIFHLRGTHLIMITNTINVGIRSQQCSWRGNTEPFLLSMEVLLVLLLCLSWKRGFKHPPGLNVSY